MSQMYRCPKPFSEIEVKNVANFMKNLKSYWNVHAYGQLILYSWSYIKNVTKDNTEMVRLTNESPFDVFYDIKSALFNIFCCFYHLAETNEK